MIRNLDSTTLRSLVAIADTGGVTRAANRLHLTQSAVSMQIKRLEELLSIRVFERAGRGVRATPEGEQLIGYARRIVALNDEAIDRLTTPRFEGSIEFGVPSDIVHPHIPPVLMRFGQEYPRMAVRLTTDNTVHLKRGMREGRFDVILTTESKPAKRGEVLLRQPLVWTGAPEGRAAQQRPLPLAFTRDCMFREPAVTALDAAGIDWFDAVDTISEDAAYVSCAADLGVRADLTSVSVRGVEPVPDHELPALPEYCVALYRATAGADTEIADVFAAMLREVFSAER